MVAFLERGHSGPHINHDAGALVTENHREEAFRIRARTGEFVGVADTAGFDLNQDFSSLRAVEIEGDDFEGLPAA